MGQRQILRIGIVGLGVMGLRHARVLQGMSGVALVGGADPCLTQRRTYASSFRGAVHADWRGLVSEALDAVVLAIPAELHGEVACALLARGLPVLIEKPLALTFQEGKRMQHTACKHGVLLAVGHVERFHPVVRSMRWQLDTGVLGRVMALHTRRWGPFPSRMQQVGILRDSAVHDIDLMHTLLGEQVLGVQGHGTAFPSSQVHAVQGTLCFANGTLGKLEVRWHHPVRVRQLVAVGEQGVLWGDLLANTLSWHPLPPGGFSWQHGPGHPLPLCTQQDPLHAELEAFVDGVHGDSRRCVSAEEGLRALHTTLRLAAWIHPLEESPEVACA